MFFMQYQMVYSSAKRVPLIELYYENDQCAKITAPLFDDQEKYVTEHVAKFR